MKGFYEWLGYTVNPVLCMARKIEEAEADIVLEECDAKAPAVDHHTSLGDSCHEPLWPGRFPLRLPLTVKDLSRGIWQPLYLSALAVAALTVGIEALVRHLVWRRRNAGGPLPP